MSRITNIIVLIALLLIFAAQVFIGTKRVEIDFGTPEDLCSEHACFDVVGDYEYIEFKHGLVIETWSEKYEPKEHNPNRYGIYYGCLSEDKKFESENKYCKNVKKTNTFNTSGIALHILIFTAIASLTYLTLRKLFKKKSQS